MEAISSFPTSRSEPDPFDLALVALLMGLRGTWQTLNIDTFTQAQENALARLTQAGLAEQRWEVAATMCGFPGRGRIRCRVTGDFGKLLVCRILECFPEWLTPDGKTVDRLSFLAESREARLTMGGERAKEDFHAGNGGRVLLFLRGVGKRPGKSATPSVDVEQFWTEAVASSQDVDIEERPAAAGELPSTLVDEAGAMLTAMVEAGAILTGKSARATDWAAAVRRANGKTCSPTTVGGTECWKKHGHKRCAGTRQRALPLNERIEASTAAPEIPSTLRDEVEDRAAKAVMDCGLLSDADKAPIIRRLREGELTAAGAMELIRTVAAQKADPEPSPFEPDQPDRPRGVRHRKRV